MTLRAFILRIFLLSLTIFAPAASGYAQVALPSESYDLNFSKGLIEYGSARYDSAEQYFRKALEAKPGDKEATYYLGQTLTRSRKYDEAVTTYRKLLEADPASGRAHLGLGIALYNQQKYREALSSLAQAERTLLNDPLVNYVNYYQGLSQYQLGVFDEARAEFQAARKADPQSDLAKTADRYIAHIESGKAGKKKIWDLSLSISAQWDDNVVVLPRGTSLQPGIGIPRSDDYSTVFFLRGEVRPFERGPLMAGADYSFYQSLHRTLSGFDVESHAPIIFVQHTAGPVQTRLQYILDYVQVGRSPYLVAHSFAPVITVTEQHDLFTRIQMRYQQQDYHDGRFLFNSLRDGHNWLIGATQYWFYAGNTAHVRLGYTFDNEVTGGKGVLLATMASAADWAYQGHRFQIGTTLPPVYHIRLDFGFDYYLQNYDSANSFAIGGTTIRRDNVYTGIVTASRDLTDLLTLALQWIHIRDKANVPAFDYDRNITSITLSARF